MLKKDRALPSATNTFETVMSDELSRADRALEGVSPVLRHVLTTSGDTLINDAVVARVRGMLNALARQLLDQVCDQEQTQINLVDELAADSRLLSFMHSSTLEAILTERLEQRSGLDPVLSPLWQELIASQDAQTGETAMRALAAQSRFLQSYRRMQCSITELPADALERALHIFAKCAPTDKHTQVRAAIKTIRADYDEAMNRMGLVTRLVATMRGGAVAGLDLEHAGFALFTSSLAQITGQSWQRCVLACHSQQAARLALALRAAGLEADAIERQFMLLEPGTRLPTGMGHISVDSAKAMLKRSDSRLHGQGAR